MSRKLYRSNEQQVIGGVCGGLGEHFDIDPTWLRLLAVLLMFASGFGLVAYLVAWIVIPRRPLNTQPVSDPSPHGATSRTSAFAEAPRGPGFIAGVILILLGMIFLFDNLFFWFDWDYVWPLALVAVGAFLIYHSVMPSSRRESSMESHTAEVPNGGR